MVKTLREILAEKDEQFDYYVKSTADIHIPKLFALVRVALTGYKVRNMEVDSYEPLSKDNPEFPQFPDSACYTLKVTTGLPLPLKNNAIVQLIAINTRIHETHLKVVPVKGDAPEETPIHTGQLNQKDSAYKPLTQNPNEFEPDPQDHEVKDAQSLVGAKRISDFMSELEDHKEVRAKEARSREVYEEFVTSHLMLESYLNRPLLKGYYAVESYRNNDSVGMNIEGPYAEKPDNMIYRDTMFDASVKAKVVSESTRGNRVILEVALVGVPVEQDTVVKEIARRRYEIAVENVESKQKYLVLVMAETVDVALKRAVQEVVRTHGGVSANLVALDPSGTTDATEVI